MKQSVNTFKSRLLNEVDSIRVKNGLMIFNLEDTNFIKDKLILLYIYRLPEYQTHGFKVGYTVCKFGETFWHAIKSRIDKQEYELALDSDTLLRERYNMYGLDREVVYWGIALNVNSEEFKDHEVHRAILDTLPGITEKNQEWFSGDIHLDDLIEIFNEYRSNDESLNRIIYTPRKEQKEAINALKNYFGEHSTGYRFLMNCKMRFGKCYTTYKYAEETNKSKVLILTFVPAVEGSWKDDLLHISKEFDFFTDFDISKDSFKLNDNPTKPYVVFLSLQNYLGKDSNTNMVKNKIKKLQEVTFDLLVLDEYHFGAWNDKTQETIEEIDIDYQKNLSKAMKTDITNALSIKIEQTLCLSGTPFKAIDRGEFNDKNSFTYSYFDEQKNKYPNSDNNEFLIISSEYEHFPDMKIFGYNMSSLFNGLFDELKSEDKILKKKYFSLNGFFKTKKDEDTESENVFIYEEHVLKWLEIIKGRTTYGYDFPYMNEKMLDNNKHTLWLLPTVNACAALTHLLSNDDYFKRYEIINLSQSEVGSGFSAFNHLNRKIKASKQKGLLGSIAITVNKLTLGVTVKDWTSVFVLKDLSSPEQYFQSIFRVQTPNKETNKKYGYVYDFNIDRAASLLLHYAEKTSVSVTKMDVANLIVKYLPIYMNGDMSQPIEEEVFFELAQLGYNSKPLSEKVKDISKTTRGLDDQTIADMINDPECSEVIKNVFAHTKFAKPTTRTTPPNSTEGFKSIESKKGRDIGYDQGLVDYKLYLEIDDAVVQNLFDENVTTLFNNHCPQEYDDKQRKYFYNGLLKGYESGVNVPIKKLQCGKDDGKNFVGHLKDKLGSNLLWTKKTRDKILNIVHLFLNNKNNIPEEYRKKMYLKWYRDSFRAAIQSELKPKIKEENGNTIEDTQNVLRHILSKVFQFLYISVYRETRFMDVFENADPYVFHSAVGIKKEEFEILNKYRVFQERVLDGYIHEFFVNESLGRVNESASEEFKKRYRNSFNWFGYGVNSDE
jgi:hypothetical protein